MYKYFTRNEEILLIAIALIGVFTVYLIAHNGMGLEIILYILTIAARDYIFYNARNRNDTKHIKNIMEIYSELGRINQSQTLIIDDLQKQLKDKGQGE